MANDPNSAAAAALNARWGGRSAVDALEPTSVPAPPEPVAAAAESPATPAEETSE